MDGFSLTYGTVVTLLLTIIATVLVLHTVWQFLTALESRSWARARGIVVDSRLEESGRSRMFRARVSYRFTVDGQELTGDRACFGDSDKTSWSWAARRIVARYHSGQAVTVYYDPARPSEAVLEPGISGALMAKMVFLMIVLAFVIWMLGEVVSA